MKIVGIGFWRSVAEMSFAQLLRAQTQRDGDVSVRWVALSADDPGSVVRAAREAGFDDYWLKPIDVPKLQAALQRLIG